jgi:DNA-binding transcriptional regulator YhcF (GntR family)
MGTEVNGYIASMRIVIDRSTAEPPFSQVSSQIATAVDTGELTVGTRLPTIRSLAGELGLAPGTIARAYRELEVRGLVDTRGRHGTFVSDPAGERTRHRRELVKLAATYAETAARLGMRPGAALDLVDQALRSASSPS